MPRNAAGRDHILYISIRLITAAQPRPAESEAFQSRRGKRVRLKRYAGRNRGKVIPLSLLFRLGQAGSFIIGLSRVRSQ